MQPFISIFNGRRRELGADTKEVFAQLWLDALEYLHLFKGARLHVFLAIALHADEDGWAWPSYERLADETGYSRDTVCQALADLCELTIDGDRVLLRYQPRAEEAGQFVSNRYLIFPNAEAVEQYEGAGVLHLAGDTGGAFGYENRVGKTPTRPPCSGFPYTENSDTNHNHSSTIHDDGMIMDEKHEAQAQEKADTDEADELAELVAIDAKAKADAIAALLERGWNDGQAATERFVAKVGADVILDMHAKKPRNIGAGYFRKHGPTWKISDNGRDPGAATSSSQDTDAKRAARIARYTGGVCRQCYRHPCVCEELEAEEVRTSAH